MYLYKCMATLINYLSLFVTWVTSIAYLGWMLEKRPVSSHVHDQAESGLMQMSIVNQNSCLGIVVMLYAIFEQFKGLNLNVQGHNYRSSLSKKSHVQKMGRVTGPLYDPLQLMGRSWYDHDGWCN